MTERERLQNQLEKIEKQLEKVRGASPITHGWQTSRLAKAQRSWDELAKVKFRLRSRLDELDNKETGSNK